MNAVRAGYHLLAFTLGAIAGIGMLSLYELYDLMVNGADD